MSTRDDDRDLASVARARMNGKVKPLGSLGRLEPLAIQLARHLGTLTPHLDGCHLLLFAGDHGLAVEPGISAYPSTVTRLMLQTFLEGRAAANVLARSVGASVFVVDAGVAGEAIESPGLISRRIAPGTANSLRGPAMTSSECAEAIDTGAALAREHAAPVLCCGEMGIGNTSAAALVAHKITGVELAHLAGPGTGLDAAGVARKRALLIEAAARTASALPAAQAMAEYGGFELAMMAGAMRGGVEAGSVVIVDGFIATASACCALSLAPHIADGLVFAHRSAEPGHRHLLAHLDVQPLLALDMRLGEGTGALLAWPLVRSAAALISEMASLEDIGVTAPPT
ncbi:MAG: nicotinate-nucleotide--dimethylbenzimidazole phosphoribosyltransferase [Pseudomonadota bacterium]